nr:LOW QUALITY PROTEIN: sp110 nuclear body protein [Manis javanica]
MFTVTRAIEETLFQHFIHQKLEIAYAIYKPFPFFETLRDNSFITERMYRESLEACGHMVPVSRVVYNILTKLENTFNLSLLKMMFSRINLHEYPDLMTILKSFRNVVTSYGRQNGTTLSLWEAPAHPAEESCLQTLALPPPPQHPAVSHPSRADEPRAPMGHSAEILAEPPPPSGPARVTQEEMMVPDNLTPEMNEGDSQEMPGSPITSVQVVRDDPPEPNDPTEPQEVPSVPPNKKGKKRKRNIWATPKKRYKKKRLPRAASPGHGIREKLQGVGQATQRKNDSARDSKVTTRAQKAKTDCAQTSGPEDPMDNGNKLSLGQSPGEKQKRREKNSRSTSKGKQKERLPRAASPGHGIREKLQGVGQATQRKDDSARNSKVTTRAQKARTDCAQTSGPEEQPKDKTVDFHAPKLPVTCGEAKGILYTKKLKKGSSEKCIQDEKGVWFTPKEFEIEGKRASAKKWKQSIHCRGKTLKQLLKEGILVCPPRQSLKRKQENSKECEVCCGVGGLGGPLLPCDTCPRAFHEDCHILPAETERSPWSCTFCRMREASGGPQCHEEAEVLARLMRPEEQLKCEFLLLKAYCHPQSSYFAETPRNIHDYGEHFKEAMWLGLGKERLTEKVYTAAWFVRDMRLIFFNHKTFYKTSDFGQVGLDIEAEFEKSLKEVLIFCGSTENIFQAP